VQKIHQPSEERTCYIRQRGVVGVFSERWWHRGRLASQTLISNQIGEGVSGPVKARLFEGERGEEEKIYISAFGASALRGREEGSRRLVYEGGEEIY